MSKTTPEEAIEIARKHGGAVLHFDQIMISKQQLAALIDEIKLSPIDEARGVDAEPVAWRTRYRSEPGMIGHYPWSYTDRIRRMQLEKYEYEPLYTHPAPSQPAAPVELPVMAKVFQKPRILEAHIPIIEPLVPWDQLPLGTELVKLSDAQAAIAAGRKAS